MDIKISPGSLHGTVRAIPSKSQAHRALICAALADKPTRVNCEGTSKDIEATAACLSELGTQITREQNCYIVNPLNNAEDNSAVSMNCGESGSTFRFILPITGALGRKVSFRLEGRLPERPLSPLYEELIRHGCELPPQGSNPFCIAGKLVSGYYSLDGGVSSQFISGLLFSLPLLHGNSELRLTGKIESFPYVEMTVAMLEKFNIKTNFKGITFSIPGGQTYRSPDTVQVEGDWSNTAFWLCAGAIGKDVVKCTGLDLRSRQGDRVVLDILTQFGAQVCQSGSSVTVSGGSLRGIEIDAKDIPDLVPILSVVAAASQGITTIRNAGRLRGKESDRLAAVTDLLNGLGADAIESVDGLRINGGIKLNGGQASSWGDHRIAMAAAIAATICKQPVVISGADAVNKSYPGFFDDFCRLGGVANKLDS